MLSQDRRIRRFTPKAGQVLNLIPSDIGRPIGDLKPNIQGLDLDELVSEVMDSFQVKELEIQDKEGRWHNLQVRPYRTAEKRIDGAVIALQDINQFKRSTLALMKAASDSETIIQAAPMPLLVLGSHQKVKLANQAFCEKFKVSHQATEGKLLTEIGDGQWNIPGLLKKIQETLSLDAPLISFEVANNFPTIGEKVMILNASKVRLAGSSEFATLLSIDDISDRKEIEKERVDILVREKAARSIAEKANLAKDEFLATLSHELRTPLTAILSWAQMLRMGRLGPDQSKRGIEILEESAKAQGQLIDDLLDISRIQAGKLNLAIQEVDPGKVITAAIESIRSLIAEKSIQIETTIDPLVKNIFADPTRLQQIMWNVLTNAIKFSSQGGRIWIKLSRITGPSGERFCIQVRDKGKGIKPEFLPVIFERFTQVDSTTTRAYGGLGLGLAIVRKLVEMHEGTVQVESPGEGKGATFTICLPVVPTAKINTAESEAEAEAEAEAGVTLRGLRILLVEDDANSREVFSVMLQSFGANVKTAESAKEALAIFGDFSPDVLVSDIAMPVEDGYSLIGKIRALKSPLAKTPALALTAYAGREDVQRANLAGFQAHVAKPVNANKLALAIARLAGRK